jgi:ABC-2 type transport system permease protein
VARLRVLVAKEVRELLRERLVLFGMIIMPALIMALLGGIQGLAAKKAVQEAVRAVENVAIVPPQHPAPGDLDFARNLSKALNATLVEEPGSPPESLLERGYRVVILLERGAWRNFTRGLPVAVRIYASLPGPSPTAPALVSGVESALQRVVQGLIAEGCRQAFPQASRAFVASPVRADAVLVVWGREVSQATYSSYLLGLYALPMTLIVLLTSAVQVGAISIGMEREAKTLEMLLASPITPGEIVSSKILGVLAVTLLGAASFTGGFAVYYYSFRSVMGQALGGPEGMAAGVSASTLAIALGTLALSLYIAGVLGLILGLGAQDVRGAQMVANYFTFLLMVPYFAVFVGVIPTPETPAGLALLLDPLYPPFIALVGAEFGRFTLALLALAAQGLHLIAWTLVASRLLSTERLIVGLPLSRLLRRRASRL